MNEPALTSCLNCATPLAGGEFCPRCGQRNRHARLHVREVLRDTWQTLADGDLPWWRTLRDLTLRPGQVVAEYADGRRVRYVNPVKYCFVIVALAVALDLSAGQAGSLRPGWRIPANLWVLLNIPVLAAAARLIYLRGTRNYAECVVYALYLSAHTVLVVSLLESLVFGSPDGSPLTFMAVCAGLLLWSAVAAGRFFGGGLVRPLLLQTSAFGVLAVVSMAAFFVVNAWLGGLTQ